MRDFQAENRAEGAEQRAYVPDFADMWALPDGVPWMEIAVRLYREGGQGEVGIADRRRLLRLLHRLSPTAQFGLPWCGLFVGHCMETAFPGIRLPFIYPRARPWLRWGERVEPQIGALMIFWHYHPKTPFGHISLYWAEDDEAYHVLGGNQHDRITIQRYPKERLLDVRWPTGRLQNGIRRRAAPEMAEDFG